MKKYLMLLAVVTIAVPSAANAVVFNFDNLLPPNQFLYILEPATGPYFGELDGFMFGAEGSIANRADVVDTGIFGLSSQSGDYALLNNVLGDIVITEESGADFSFQSAYVTGYFNEGQRSIVGFLDGIEVASISFGLTNSWQQVTGNFSTIDRLVFELTNNGHDGLYFIDNLVLNESSAVPEPSTMLLLGSGLLGLVGLNRRRKA